MKKLIFILSIIPNLLLAQWLPQLAGFSSQTPSIKFAKEYRINDSTEYVEFAMTGQTSNSTIFYLTLPYAAANSALFGTGISADNGNTQTTPLRIDLTKGSNIIRLYKTPAGIGWSGGGGKNCDFGFTYGINPGKRQNLVFLGNSLLNYGQGVILSNGYYPCIQMSYDLGLTYKNISSQLLSINGQETAYMNRDFNSYVAPFVDSNTVVLQWGITVDVAQGLSPDSVWKDTKSLADKIHAKGGKIVVTTFIARNATGDAASVYANGNIVNDSIRANSGYFDGVNDIALNPVFDQKTDANSATIYQTDHVHLLQPGQDSVRYNTVRNLKATGFFH